MITEAFGSGDFATPTLRWDQLDVLALARRRMTRRQFDLMFEVRVGATIAGNLGGLAIQDGWHRLTKTGVSEADGLQNNYPGSRRAGAIAGGQFSVRRPAGPLVATGAIDGQLAVGATGVSRLEARGGARLPLRFGNTQVVFTGELAFSRLHTVDENLRLNGAYGTGSTERSLLLTLAVVRGPYAAGYQYRANESGSGEPTALLWFEMRGAFSR